MSPSENPAGTENQQGSLSATDIAWLAGLWDGDGWIGITKAKRTNTKQNRYSASVMLVTTSDRIADRTVDILRRMGCPVTSQYKRAKHAGSDGSWRREKWNIVIRSNVGTKKFLETVGPYLIEKSILSDLVLSYIRWREQMPHRAAAGGEQLRAIAEKAETIRELCRQDRERNDPSEAIRLTPAG